VVSTLKNILHNETTKINGKNLIMKYCKLLIQMSLSFSFWVDWTKTDGAIEFWSWIW